ncbi:MAG: RsiV family protein [Oscillibacter sp.]|jgi:hypothetical protein|nr:RsiV family protein [Oscillibacter sp.]
MDTELLDTEPVTAEQEWTVDGIPVLTASVSIPRPTGPGSRLTRKIAWFYRMQGRSYLRYCKNFLYPETAAAYRQALAAGTPLPSHTAELTYRVTLSEQGFWSLYTESREQTDGHLEILRRGDTWNLRMGTPAPLADFFPKHYPIRKNLLQAACEEIERQERAGISRYHSRWRQELRHSFSRENFYLTPEGLCIFWPMYAVAPATEGIPAFCIPFSEDGCRIPPPILPHLR